MPTFKALDGKEFTSKKEWREYMMATFYSFKDIKDATEPHIKGPDSIKGQMFDIGECENSTLVVMDHTEQVQIDYLKNCRVFIGACASSLFIRNCENCTFYAACQQLRLREVTDSTFYVYSRGEVHIEESTRVRFAPFNGGYPEQAAHFKSANLDATRNCWYDVYDHNDPDKTGKNWSLMQDASQYEEPWFPAGACEPCVPRTAVGSVAKPKEEAMQSFSMDQMRADAAKAQSPAKPPAAAPAAAPPLPAPSATDAAAAQQMDDIAAAISSLAANTSVQPAVPPEHTGQADQATLGALLQSFAGLKAGDDASSIFAPFASVVLPIAGKPAEMPCADYVAALPLQGSVLVGVLGKINVLYCHAEDVHRWRGACAPAATATCWLSSSAAPPGAAPVPGQQPARLASVMFAKVSEDPADRENECAPWRVCHVHMSEPAWV